MVSGAVGSICGGLFVVAGYERYMASLRPVKLNKVQEKGAGGVEKMHKLAQSGFNLLV